MDESHKDRDTSHRLSYPLGQLLDNTHRVTMPLQLSLAMLAAIVDDTPIPMMLFYRHQRVKHIVTLLHGPTRVVKDYIPKRRITYDPTNKMTIDDNSDDWCLEYLRFTRAEIKEIAFVLQIPSVFRYRIRYTPKSRYRCCRR